jgi:cell shape-determining protein MreC
LKPWNITKDTEILFEAEYNALQHLTNSVQQISQEVDLDELFGHDTNPTKNKTTEVCATSEDSFLRTILVKGPKSGGIYFGDGSTHLEESTGLKLSRRDRDYSW